MVDYLPPQLEAQMCSTIRTGPRAHYLSFLQPGHFCKPRPVVPTRTSFEVFCSQQHRDLEESFVCLMRRTCFTIRGVNQ